MKTPTLVLAVAGVLAIGGCVDDVYFYTLTHPTSSSGGTGGVNGTGGTGGAMVCKPGAMQPCYGGKLGTEGVGTCKGGTETCAADGSSWSACVGEVLPQPVEDCASNLDQNCDGIISPCKGNLRWAKGFGDASDQYSAGVCVDAMENVVVTGGFSGTIDFGDLLTSAGGSDAFVAKLDTNGNYMWSKSFGDAQYQIGYGVATDSAGNVFVVGNFAGAVDFGGGVLNSVSPGDVFVLKLDVAGHHVWSKRFGGMAGQAGYGIATSPDGGVVVTGLFYGTIDFGGGQLLSAGEADIFVAKLDVNGDHLWSKRFGDASNQIGYAVATDPMSNTVLTGSFVGAVDFGGGSLQSAGGADVFVLKLDANGNHAWSKRYGDASDQIGYSVAADATGEILVTGALYGSADFAGGKPIASAGGSDIFAVKVDADGNHVWSKRFGDASDQVGHGVAMDAAGNAILTGSFTGAVDFGGGSLVSAGTDDFFLAKLDAKTGEHLWSRRAGGIGNDSGSGVCVASSGDVFVTGSFAASVDFGGGPLKSGGGSDVFIASFGP